MPDLPPIEIPFHETLVDGNTSRLAVTVKMQAMQQFRAHSADHSQTLDHYVVTQLAKQASALRNAQTNVEEMNARLAAYLDKPYHPGRYLYTMPVGDGEVRHVVSCSPTSRLALALHRDVDPTLLMAGCPVLLGPDRNVIVAVCGGSEASASESAEFLRWEREDRSEVRVRSRDEMLILHAAGPLRQVSLAEGDLVRFDREMHLAVSKLDRHTDQRFVLQSPPDIGPEVLGGLDDAYEAMVLALSKSMTHRDAAARLGALNKPPSILLKGPTGCGKTLLTRAATAELNRRTGCTKFAYVPPGGLESMWVGETQRKIRTLFESLREAEHAVLFLDEVDSIGSARGHNAGYHQDRFLTALLCELDGYTADGRRASVVAATNKPESLDAALLSRFGTQIYVPRPNRSAGTRIFNIHMPESVPFHHGLSARSQAIDGALHRIFAPTDDSLVARLTFTDGKQQGVHGRDLVTGRLISDVCERAKDRALARVVRGEADLELRIDDLEFAVESVLEQAAQALRPSNAHQHLSLPDKQVSAVTPVRRALRQPSLYVMCDPGEVAA